MLLVPLRMREAYGDVCLARNDRQPHFGVEITCVSSHSSANQLKTHTHTRKNTVPLRACALCPYIDVRLNLCKLYDGPIRLLADYDFTVRCIQDRRRPLEGTFND